MNKTYNKSRNTFVFFLVDICLVLGALFIAFLLRFDFAIPENIIDNLFIYIPAILFAKLTSFFIFGLYRGMWRYTSISDFINIIKASSFGSLFSVAFLALLYGLSGFPKSVLFIDYALCTIFLGASRASIRLHFSNISGPQSMTGRNTLQKVGKN